MSTRNYGSGTLTQLPDGSWRLRIYAGRGDPATGKVRQPERRFRGSETAAKKELRRFQAEFEAGRVDPTTATVADLLSAWLADVKPDQTPSTWDENDRTVTKVLEPAFGSIRVARLTTEQIDRWVAGQLARLAPATVVRQRAVLKAALAMAKRRKWISENPASDCKPIRNVSSGDTAVPTPTEVSQYRATCRDRDTLTGHLMDTAIGLASYFGLRRGELVALKWGDLDVAAGMLTVRRGRTIVRSEVHEGDTKTHQVRVLAVSALGVEMLTERMAYQRALADAAGTVLVDDPYFLSLRADGAQPCNPDLLTKAFGNLSDGRYKFHSLRHFVGTHLAAAGIPQITIMRRLGHRSLRTTDRYTHPLEAGDVAAAELMGRLLE